MNPDVLEPLVVVVTTVVVPAVVGLLAVVLDRVGPGRVTWPGYVLGALLVSFLLVLSPSAWTGLLSDAMQSDRALLAHGYLIFGPWLGAFFTAVVGIICGAIGSSRYRARQRETAAAESMARWRSHRGNPGSPPVA
jgi:hypothetical protein